ncbi:uncharacterized protein LOC141716718 [Apium graveolens]|uniref:uncharacterized protein LOC141716718 n=1 Tax=Apium graveolens TaxID=4045 RepID=UPI003D7962D3
MQFLMGLGDMFTAIRGHILLMKPIPTLSQCYAMLLQDENQRDVQSVSGMNSGSVAMNVRSMIVGRPASKGVGNNQNSSAFMKKNNTDSTLFCEVCHMQGHSKEKCFCVVGYPSWHRLFGKPKPKPRFSAPQRTSAAHVAMTSSDSNIKSGATGTTGVGSQDGSGINSHGLSDSQFNHLVQLLQNTMKSPSSDASPATWSSANTVHLAGPYLEEGVRDW